MPKSPNTASVLRVSDLSQTQPTAFSLTPDAAEMRQIAASLDLSALRKLSFKGEIRAQGKSDWRLEGQLGATVVQPCVATLGPVTTRIEDPVLRTYLAAYDMPDGPEVEMPEDDTIEPVPANIDLREVMLEALALNIPAYPRADGSAPVEAAFTEPGKTPMSDDDARPFAGLAGLRDALSKPDPDGS